MENNILKNTNKKFLAFAIFAISLIILVFLTSPLYTQMITLNEEKNLSLQELKDKETILKSLEDIKKEIIAKSSSTSKAISKYALTPKEDKLLTYFYDFAGINKGKLVIDSLSIGESKTNDLGFEEVSVSIRARFATLQDYTNFMRFLIDEKSKYKFVVDTASIPYTANMNNFSTNIKTQILYVKQNKND